MNEETTPYKMRYLCTQKVVDLPKEFIKQRMGKYFLYHYQGMLFESYEVSDVQYYFLGDWVHCDFSRSDKNEIFKTLKSSYQDFIEFLNGMCGVFCVFRIENNELSIFNDPCACLKVFIANYSDETNDAFASDFDLLKLNDDLEPIEDSDAVAYYSSDFYSKKKLFFADKTPYRNVFQLLPNFLYNFSKKKIKRFYPTERMEPQTLDKAVGILQGYFKNIISAISENHALMVGLTAGLDSRVVLSMCSNGFDKIGTYTFLSPVLHDQHIDIKIPKLITKKLKLPHQIVPYEEFKTSIHEEYLTTFEHISRKRANQIDQGFMNIQVAKNNCFLLGIVSEIGKNYYDTLPIDSADKMIQINKYPKLPFVQKTLELKLEKTLQVNELGYAVNDFLHWEQDIANFAGMNLFFLNQKTLAIAPFNCRKVIDVILSTDTKYRDKQDHELYRRLIDLNIPEVSNVPINPSLKLSLIRLAKKIGIYGVYKQLSLKLK